LQYVITFDLYYVHLPEITKRWHLGMSDERVSHFAIETFLHRDNHRQ